MSREHIGRTIVLEPDKIYLVISESPEDSVSFAVVDTLDYESDDANFLACITRGMIDYAIKQPELAVDIGAKAFEKDNVKQGAASKSQDTIIGSLDGFPKTIGNA